MNAWRITCAISSLTAPTLKAHTRVDVKRVTKETDRSVQRVRLRLSEHDFHLRISNPEPWSVRIPRGYFHTKIKITIFREEATSALVGFHVGPLSWSKTLLASQVDSCLTGQTPHGVLMSPVTGSRGLSTLKSFLCPFDEDPKLLSATSDISAFPSKTNVFKIVSMSPSDS